MRALLNIISYLAVLIISTSVPADPIPYPVPAIMPLADMHAYLSNTEDEGLEARFKGKYYFTSIPYDVIEMKYPLPPESNEISVDMGQLSESWTFSEARIPYIYLSEYSMVLEPLPWFYVDETYPTVLPFWSDIPMIAWYGPFPEERTRITVEYSQFLPEFKHGHVFFYALGTGKYDFSYQEGTFAFLDISMPKELHMKRMYLDEAPLPYAVTFEEDEAGEINKIVSIFVSNLYGEFSQDFTQDIIGYVTDWDKLFDRDGEDLNAEERESDHEDLASRSPHQSQLMLRYEVEQCGINTPTVDTRITTRGNKILVSDSIYFNCCAEYVRMTIMTEEQKVVLREKAVEEAPCDCICYYPMQGVAGPFEEGIYDVELLDPHGELILQRYIEIK